MMRPQPPDTIKLFYCYERADADLRKKLENALVGLKRGDFLEDWSDAEIKAGSTVNKEIEAHLKSADILLLLISPSFLSSDYCYHVLMQGALQRHRSGDAVAVLVLLRPVDWHDPSFDPLPRLPSTGKAVSTWSQRDEAFKDIARGLRSQLKEVWLRKGDTYYKTLRYNEALLSFEQAIHQDPAFGPAYVRRGSVLRDMGRYQEAEVSFEAALRQNPMDADTYFQVGSLLYDAKEYSRAISAFDQAIQLNHLHVTAHIYKGLAFERKGESKKALETYEHYLHIHPNDPLVSYFWRNLSIRTETGEFWQASTSKMRSAISPLLGSFSQSVLSSFLGSSSRSEDPTESFFSSFQAIALSFTEAISIAENQLQQWSNVLQRAFTALPRQPQHSESEDGRIQGFLNDLLSLEADILGMQLMRSQEILNLVQALNYTPIPQMGPTIDDVRNRWDTLAATIAEKRSRQQSFSEHLLDILRQKELRGGGAASPL